MVADACSWRPPGVNRGGRELRPSRINAGEADEPKATHRRCGTSLHVCPARVERASVSKSQRRSDRLAPDRQTVSAVGHRASRQPRMQLPGPAGSRRSACGLRRLAGLGAAWYDSGGRLARMESPIVKRFRLRAGSAGHADVGFGGAGQVGYVSDGPHFARLKRSMIPEAMNIRCLRRMARTSGLTKSRRNTLPFDGLPRVRYFDLD